LLTSIVVYPLFRWMDTGSVVAVCIAMAVFAVLNGCVQGAMAVAMVDLFPPRLRYSGMAIGYNMTLAIFGGTAPLVATWLITETGDLTAPAWYLVIISVATLLFTLSMKPYPEGQR
jgi:MHS family proline/betaine transporter-like MFS transporter